MPTYHKVPKCPHHPFPKSHGNPKSMNKLINGANEAKDGWHGKGGAHDVLLVVPAKVGGGGEEGRGGGWGREKREVTIYLMFY